MRIKTVTQVKKEGLRNAIYYEVYEQIRYIKEICLEAPDTDKDNILDSLSQVEESISFIKDLLKEIDE
jgi:hypothetical protein